jgi:PAS domain S-box-containing protein
MKDETSQPAASTDAGDRKPAGAGADALNRQAPTEPTGRMRAAREDDTQAREYLQTVLDTLPAGVCILDKDGRLLATNNEFRRIWTGNRTTAPPLIGTVKEAATYRGWWADTGEPLVGGDWGSSRALASGETSFGEVIDIERFDGTRGTILNNAAPLRDAQGNITGAVAAVLDITERRRAERSSLQGLSKLEAALAAMADAVFISDTEGNFIHLNDAFATYHRFRSKNECGRTFAEYPDILEVFFANGDPAPVDQWAVPRALRGETATGEVYILRRKDTGERWIGSYNLAPVRDKDGAIIGSVVVGRDITAQKEAESALRESEARLSLALDAGRLATWEIDMARGTTTVAPALFEMLGLPVISGDMTRGAWFELSIPEDRERVSSAVREAARTGNDYRMEYRIRRADDGRIRWMSSQGVPIRDAKGECTRMVGVIADITDRKQAEERTRALQQITSALSAALTQEQVVEVVLNRAVPLTGAAMAAVGLLLEDGGEMRCVYSRSMPDRTRSEWARCSLDARLIATDAVRKGRTVVASAREQFEASYPDGDEFLALGMQAAAGLPLRVGDRMLGAAALFFDHAREFAAEEIAFLEAVAGQAAQALERAWLYEQSERRSAGLREADQRKDEFLAMLAHELRNPLAAISSAAQVLKGAEIEGQARQASEIVGRQAGHMARLLDDLLDVSRVTQGKIRLRRQRVALGAAIESALEAARPRIEERSHQLFISYPAHQVNVDGDPVRIAQMVGNLLNNAAKYTRQPGGEIHVIVEPRGGEVAVRVRDNGIGIEPRMLPRVFDRFVQDDSQASPGQSGLGIGLTMVRSLAEMHGGRVEARSEGAGKGSEFVVWLPIAGEAAKEDGRPEEAPARSCRILVVDDNADTAEMLRLSLEIDGHQVATAHAGPAALETAARFRPEFVLLDLGMPGIDGYEVARRMKANPDLAGAVLVALTGYGQDEDRERTLAAGFHLHLVKPVDMDELKRVLCRRPTDT